MAAKTFTLTSFDPYTRAEVQISDEDLAAIDPFTTPDGHTHGGIGQATEFGLPETEDRDEWEMKADEAIRANGWERVTAWEDGEGSWTSCQVVPA